MFAPGIGQGSKVECGEFIAYMGDSGDAETTAPHLHFELHRPDGVTIDPYASLQAASHSPAAVGRAVAANPNGGWHELTGDGRVVPRDGAPSVCEPAFGWDIARALVLTASGQGSYVLDGWGGVHAAGDAVPRGGPWWPGWDVARGLVATGADGYAMLDAWGGVHPAGSAPAAAPGSWAQGADWQGIAFQGGHY